MRTASLMAGGLVLLCAAPAAAACQLGAQPVAPMTETYDPFGGVGVQFGFDVVVTNAGDADCQADLYLAPENGALSLAGPGGALGYAFRTPSLPAGPLMGPLSVTVPAGGSRAVAVLTELAPGQVVAPGAYEGELRLELRQDQVPVTLAHPTVAFLASVPARAQMSISGVRAPGRGSIGMAPPSIDFDILETGESRTVFVNVWANSSVRVSLRSEKGGFMRHEDDPSLPAIPYGVTLDGAPLVLTAEAQIQRTPPMSLAGASYPMAVTVGSVSGKFAGRYSDIITVSVDEN